MNSEKIRQIARKYALQNALQFQGKANTKAVAGKVIADVKGTEISPKEIFKISGSICSEINTIPLEKQIEELKKIAPELLHKEKKERDFSLPPLPNAEQGKVVTRFPPEPNGYLHIGHAKAAIIDSEYAKFYDGQFILRFDDTNPENAQLDFYEAQKEDLRWLDISWDEEYHTSDHIELHYQFAEKLIDQGNAYMCQCPPDVVKEGRFHSKECLCRKKSVGETRDLWRDLLSSGESQGSILRLKGDLKSENTAMRDPTLFRVIDKEHPLKGSKYRVWPTYDFAGAIEDSISGVTHPFRTKEYELRDPVYFKILALLNLRKPHLMEFSRLSIQGMPVSKRKIKPLIEKNLVSGYDDVRLPTLRGLKKRGILPKAIKQFVFSQGISKVESTVAFSIVEALNRKLLDPLVKRYFFVPHPILLQVKNAPEKMVTLKSHPTIDMGERKLKTASSFFIAKTDVEQLQLGDIFRLKELYNIKVTEIGTNVMGEYAGEELLAETSKIQWVTNEYHKIKLITPGPLFKADAFNPNSIQETEGYGEPSTAEIPHGNIVQFERVGFVRIEKHQQGIIGFLAHK
jgi:glutamyl-tRNA synthetase